MNSTAVLIDYHGMLNADPGQAGPLDFFDARGHRQTVPVSALAQQVRVRAGGLTDRGVGPGDRVVLVATTTPDYIATLLATLAIGAIPCSVAPPAAPRDTAHLDAAVRVVDPAYVLAPRRPIATTAALLTFEELGEGPDEPLPPAPAADPAAVHHIQLTSGSTSSPKAVVLSYANVSHNITVMARAMAVSRDRDRLFNWLPLYHDMGLVQVLGALFHRLPVGLMAPLAFLRDPLAWPRHMTSHRSTITAGPPFAYRSAAEWLHRPAGRAPDAPEIDLSALRFAYVGAEPIPSPTLQMFTDAFGPLGLRPDALTPCYGMAESVLATTVAARSDNGTRVRVHEGPAGEMLVSCGQPIEGLEVRIVDPDDGSEVSPGVTGEIAIRGPSVMVGYRNADGSVWLPANGWHDTGDRGVLIDGELYVVGRTKEMVIVRGRNFPPYDVERAIEDLPGLGPGSAAVISVPDRRADRAGGESVVAVIGATPAAGDPAELRAAVAAAVRRAFGFSPDDVVVVARRRMPRTTSGKLRRLEIRDRYLRGLL